MTTSVIDPKIRPAFGRNQNSPAGQHGKAEKKGKEYVRGEIKLPVRHYKAPPIDPQYDRLLHEIQPRPPRSKGENQRLLAAIEKLMKKGEDDRTSAEDAMLDLLVTLVGEYEQRVYPRKKSTPAEMLAFLMEQNNLTSTKLPLPANRVSEILSGKREVSKEQAKSLGDFFHVSPALFL